MNELNEKSKLLDGMLGRKEKVILPEVQYDGVRGALKSIYNFLSEVRLSNLPEYKVKNGELYRPAGWGWARPVTKFLMLEKKVDDSEVSKRLGKIIPEVGREVERGIKKFDNALGDLENKLEERDKKIDIAINYSGTCYKEELTAIKEYECLINQQVVNERRVKELRTLLGKGNNLKENLTIMNEYDSLLRNNIIIQGLYERAELISSSKNVFKREEDESILTALEMQRKGHLFIAKGKLIIESTQNVLSHADLNMSSMEILFKAYKSLQFYSSTPQNVTKIADLSNQSVLQLFGMPLPALPQR